MGSLSGKNKHVCCVSPESITQLLYVREIHQVFKHSCFVKWGNIASGLGPGTESSSLPPKLAQAPTQSVENHYCAMRKIKQCKFYKLQGDAEE